jgi:hypothetical protein
VDRPASGWRRSRLPFDLSAADAIRSTRGEYSDFWSEMFIKNGLDIKEGEDFELEGSSTDVDLDGLE